MANKRKEFPAALPWTGLTLDAWCASPQRTAFAQKLWSHPLGKELISVLVSTCPVPDISDATRAGLEAARTRGYQQAVAVLLKMAEQSGVPHEEVPADYSATVEQLLTEPGE